MEEIKAAAWAKKQSSLVIGTGKNHEEALVNTPYYPNRMNEIEPGFITNTNRFVSRQIASQIAYKAGQIKTEADEGGLISEELWLWRNPPYQYDDKKGYYLKDEPK